MPATQQSSQRALNEILSDELAGMAVPQLTFVNNVVQYFRFLWTTWTNVIFSMPYLISSPLTLLSVLIFAAGSSAIMFAMVFVTTLLNKGWIQRIFAPNGVSFVNAAYPQIFDSITEEIKLAAYSVLNSENRSSPADEYKYVFDLEVAKLLMVIAALCYEGETTKFGALLDQAKLAGHGSELSQEAEGGDLLRDAIGREATEKAIDLIGQSNPVIKKIAEEKLSLSFAPISFLSTNTSSLASAFYKPGGNFIIVAFKGTNPAEFAEWIIDFTYSYAPNVDYLKGYRGVHNGFYSQLFEPPKTGNRKGVVPYDLIRKSIKEIALQLQAQNGGKQIQLWATGHSLGSGLSSTFFARASSNPGDFGKDANGRRLIKVRDAYTFATPIFGDYTSKNAFNQEFKDKSLDKPAVLWRITNNDDIVATGLPQGGDSYTTGRFGNENNQFGYAHIGQELKMKASPQACKIGPGTLFPSSTRVSILSHLKGNGVGPNIELPLYYRFGLSLPIIGRFVSHGASGYCASLCQIRASENEEFLAAAQKPWF